MIISLQLCFVANFFIGLKGYTNVLYSISVERDYNTSDICKTYEASNLPPANISENDPRKLTLWSTTTTTTVETTSVETSSVERDPMDIFQNTMRNYLFGEQTEKKESVWSGTTALPVVQPPSSMEGVTDEELLHDDQVTETIIPDHYPSGNILRGELYQNRSGVHMPLPELLHRGHCRLNVTMDFMQTAVNAFTIFLHGNLADVQRLPADYVLHSARSISMMTIAREKLAATWAVVKGKKRSDEVTFQTLELYRPLFKYLNGKEIAKLNLSDPRILTYIGTHADLNRHQVGVVASKYIKMNKYWSEPKYLNMMNNLLCGVPMTFMRRIPENTYLQLSHQVFYHIRACDPLQRRFYLAMMTRSQALGKSYSWNARDVSRLGLLLKEVDGPDLSAINPEAVAGINAHVMWTLDSHNLLYFTDNQLKFMAQKPLNILNKKLKCYADHLRIDYSKSMKIKSAIITSPFILLYLVCK